MWYVIQVKTGSELPVCRALEARGITARVPRENRCIRSGGQWIFKEYILFPGYVFVYMKLDAGKYYAIKDAPGVIRFLGEEGKPSTLTYQEAEWLQMLYGVDNLPVEPAVAIVNGDELEVLDGALQYFTKKIIKIDKRARRVTVSMDLCGKTRELKLSFIPPGEEPAADEDDLTEQPPEGQED